MRLVLLLLLTSAAVSAQRPPAKADTLRGTVVLPDGVTLPPRALLTVALHDRVDLYRLGDVSVAVGGRSGEIRFAIGYDASGVNWRNRYALSVQVRDADYQPIYSGSPEYVRVRFDQRRLPSAPVRLALGPPSRRDRVVHATGPAPLPSATPARPASGTGVSTSGMALDGTPWRLVSMDVTPAHAFTSTYTVVFRSSGLYSGEATNCTRFGGSYEATGDGSLTLRPSAPPAAQCSGTPDPLFASLLEGSRHYERAGDRLVLSGPAGSLTFGRDTWRDDTDTMPVLDADRTTDYACGAEGTFRLRTGRGDVEVWLSDSFAARESASAPFGIYHVLPQLPAQRGAFFSYGPVRVALEKPGEARLALGLYAVTCTEVSDESLDGDGPRLLQAEGDTWGLEVVGAGPGRAVLSFFDGVTLLNAPATIEAARGQTVYRGAGGFTVTVTADACPDAPGRRVVVARPEGTFAGCTLPSD